jgi:hypothetical protein
VKAGPAAAQDSDIDTGSLRGDLLALVARLASSQRSAGGSLALLLLQAGIEDAELCEHLENTGGPTGARLPLSVIDAAIARGELPHGVSPFAFEEVAGSVIMLRTLNGLPTDQSYLEQLVDAVLLPTLRASNTADGPHSGIFSGHPLERNS